MNIQDEYNPSTVPGFRQFMISRVVKEDIFTLFVYVPTFICVQATIPVTVYSQLVS